MRNAELERLRIRVAPGAPGKVSVYDVIREVAGNDAYRKTWLDISLKFPEVRQHVSYHKFQGQGQRETPVVSVDHISWLARKVLCGARMPIGEKRRRMEQFGCEMDGVELEIRKFTEEEVTAELRTALAACGPVKQFGIGPYRIDLYLAKDKIAIECDENGHRAYSSVEEQQRQAFIEQQLGCAFVRFDPYRPDFSIVQPIGEVVTLLRRRG